MFDVDPDIRRARTPPAELYEKIHRKLLRKSWHLVPHLQEGEGRVQPFDLIDAPVVLARSGEVRCFSNVCTHRANIVVSEPACLNSLRCRYHGRKFDLAGKFVSMPEFEGAMDFPRMARCRSARVLSTSGCSPAR